MNSKAFTLIEVIVVLIILGVLAAIAVPNLYRWIERSKVAEAYLQLGGISKDFQACYNSKADLPTCYNQIDDNKNNYKTSYFDYSIYQMFPEPAVAIIATRNVDVTGDQGGQIVCKSSGTGVFNLFVQRPMLGLVVEKIGNNIQVTYCTPTSLYSGL